MIIVAVSISSSNAQEFRIGINGGLPIGDIEDFYTFNATLDINYLWEVSDQFDAGATASYSHYFGDSMDSFDFDDASFLPIAVAGRFNASESFTIGADIGYAIGIEPDGNDGGFYYAPKIQYGMSESIDIVAAYRGISIDGGGTFGMISLGLEFGL